LALPGVIAIGLLLWLRARVPEPLNYEVVARERDAKPVEQAPLRLPRDFWLYAGFTATTMLGFATFGILSFHMVEQHLIAPAVVPVLYGGVMVVDALAALATGWAYDRFGPRVLFALPIVAATVPLFGLADSLAAVIVGSLLWGITLGVQESTLRATVADLVGSERRSTAYGVFAAIIGVATLAGGALSGALYDVSIPALVVVTIVVQAVALLLFLVFTSVAKGRAKRAENSPPTIDG
jgi:MFS family permease